MGLRNVNDAFSAKMFVRNSLNNDTYLYTFHFRIFTVTAAFDETGTNMQNIENAFETAYTSAIMTFMATELEVYQVNLQWITPALGITYSYVPTAIPVVGLGTTLSDAPPQNCAVVIKKSFATGRAAIGRNFFGPFAPTYDNSGLLVQNPILSTNITTLKNVPIQPLSVAAVEGPLVCRPIVCPRTMVAATAAQDVRLTQFSPTISMLHSRKIGRGM